MSLKKINYFYLRAKMFFYTNPKLFNVAFLILAFTEGEFLRQLEQLMIDEPNLHVHSLEKKTLYSYELKFKHYSYLNNNVHTGIKLSDMVYSMYPGVEEARQELLNTVRNAGFKGQNEERLHFILSINLNNFEQKNELLKR